MDAELLADHLERPRGRGMLRGGAHRGSAGGAPCGDVVEFRVALERAAVTVGFDAEGCGALIAASSAIVESVDGTEPLVAALTSTDSVSGALGGLPAAKLHAAELAVDAFHRALGAAVLGSPARPQSDRVLVAMSGGVDSSVAAALATQGGDAVGVTVELWRDGANDAAASCCSHVAVRRARAQAHAAGMAHFTLDLREQFRVGVVDPWVEGHREGTTPNPCVQCNGRVRIAPMVDLMEAIGARRLVTGHYARIAERDDPRGPLLRAGAYPAKDQAYALARVPAAVLARLDFPLGELAKEEVRERAAALGLSAAATPDSQDLCFLAGEGREGFLRRNAGLGEQPGAIVDLSGRRIGSHRGHFHHTVGQRRGLGVGGGTPLYVISTDPGSNTVVAGPRSGLDVDRVRLTDVDLRRPVGRVRMARLRHRAPAGRVRSIVVDGDQGEIVFEHPLARVAAGQMACLMDGDAVVGCGTVTAAGP